MRGILSRAVPACHAFAVLPREASCREAHDVSVGKVHLEEYNEGCLTERATVRNVQGRL